MTYSLVELKDTNKTINIFFEQLPNVEQLEYHAKEAKSLILGEENWSYADLEPHLDAMFTATYKQEDLDTYVDVPQAIIDAFNIARKCGIHAEGRYFMPNVQIASNANDRQFYYRIRKYNDQFNKDNFDKADLYARPREEILSEARVNERFESFLYTANSPLVLPSELRLTTNDRFMLIGYLLTEKLDFLDTNLDHDHLRNQLNSEESKSKFDLICEFQQFLFKQTDLEPVKQYNLSNKILNYFLLKTKAIHKYGLSGVFYTSLRSSHGNCIAFTEEAQNKLQVIYTYDCQLLEDGTIHVIAPLPRKWESCN